MGKDNGGPAFPRTLTINDGIDSYEEKINNGMTLRDYFAGQALAGNIIPDAHVQSVERIAHECYAMADAMLAERSKGE